MHVRLEGFRGTNPSGLGDNLTVARELQQRNVDAQVVDRDKNDRPQLHLKAAICDGVAYLDDCNWRKSGDTIVRDTSPQDVAALKSAALYDPSRPSPKLALNKFEALKLEADLLEKARKGDRVDVETESIDAGSPVYDELMRLPARGVRCRLLANYAGTPKQQSALRHLADDKVEVRTCAYTEKFATVDRRKAWIGSANATPWQMNPDSIEWGTVTGGNKLVRTIQRHFDAHWKTALRIDAKPE